MINERYQEILDFILKYGYFGVFIGGFMDNSGTPTPLVIIMSLVVSKKLNILMVFLLYIIGGTLSDVIFFILGFFVGNPFIQRVFRIIHFDLEKLEKAKHFFCEYSDQIVVWGRFMTALGSYMPISCGFLRITSIRKFLFLSFIGNTIMVVVFGFLSYVFWAHIILYNSNLTFTLFVGVFTIGIQVLISFIFIRKSKIRREKLK